MTMSSRNHFEILTKGVTAWNTWRRENPTVQPALSGVDFSGLYLEDINLENANLHSSKLIKANLGGALLTNADLRCADLIEANLEAAVLNSADLAEADLSRAVLNGASLLKCDLREASFSRAVLQEARLDRATIIQTNFSNADLQNAILSEATIYLANFCEANLTGAALLRTSIVDTDFAYANLTDCWIYGISAWNLKLENAIQNSLRITNTNEAEITIDNLEVAQFVYLLLNNSKIRDVINTVTSKVVLILGSFSSERKKVLDSIRNNLRKRNFVPVIFDFHRPAKQNLTETVSSLAHLARFVIADITEARSVPQELERIVPHRPSLPVRPLILESHSEYGMFSDFRDYPWVLPLYRYRSIEDLILTIDENVIGPLEAKAVEIEKRHDRIRTNT